MNERNHMRYLLLITVLLLAPLTLKAQTVSVSIVDDNGSSVENAVVSLVSDDTSKNFHNGAKSNPVMVQQGQEFVPRVLPVRLGSDVSFPNRDNFRHMIYSFSQAKRFEVQLYGGEDQVSVNFDKAGVVTLGCNIHDNMVGYIYVVETDHFAKSDSAGKIELTDLQPGAYKATVWHPNLQRNFDNVTQDVIIEEGSPVSIDFKLALTQVRTITNN